MSEKSVLNKEVDLVQAFVDLIKTIKMNKLFLIFCLFTGVGFGLYTYFLKPSSKQVVLQNKVILDSKIVSNEIISALFNVINQEDLKTKSVKMNLSEKETELLSSVDSKIVSYTLKTNDSTLNSMIELDVKYDDNLKLNKLMEGIKYYVSSNQYLQKKLRVKLKELNDESKLLSQLIADLSVSNKKTFNLISLISRKSEVDNLIKSSEIVEVISVNSASVYDSPIGFSGKLIRVILLGVTGLFFGFLIIYIRNFHSIFRKRINAASDDKN